MEKAFIEVQNDVSAGACYDTFVYNKSAKKYGFLYISTTSDDFVGLMAFDSPKDWADLMGCQKNEVTYLTRLAVGETCKAEDGIKYIRLW